MRMRDIQAYEQMDKGRDNEDILLLLEFIGYEVFKGLNES